MARIRKPISRDNWSVEVRGNEITVRRNKPVMMARVPINAPEGAKPLPDSERTIRFVLRFAPKMSVDEYDRLAAVNAASDKEYDRLHRAVGLPHKFDELLAETPAEKERVRAFRAAFRVEDQDPVFACHSPVVAVVGSPAIVSVLICPAGGPWPHRAGVGVGQEDHLDVTQGAAPLW